MTWMESLAVLNREDVGHRVVVRRRVGTLRTDLLGELIAIDDRELVVRRDNGAMATIDRTEVVAAKRIPPRPVHYSEIVALERLADAAWPAPVHERLGEWYLRAAGGWTTRANSALSLGDPGCPLSDAATACREWYEARGLPPKVIVPLPVRRDVAEAFTRLGWHPLPTVLVQTARLTDVLTRVEDTAGTVVLTTSPSPEFLSVVSARKSGLPAEAWHVLTTPKAVRFAEVREEGALLALARGAVVEETLHLGLVEVVPAGRRRGLAQRVSRALAAWAEELGATRAVLQVEEVNAPAIRLYERLGFQTHHRYIAFAWQ